MVALSAVWSGASTEVVVPMEVAVRSPRTALEARVAVVLLAVALLGNPTAAVA